MEEKFRISILEDRVQHLIKQDKKLALVINRIGDIEANSHNDPFSFIIGEIVGQMLSNKVADVIYDRLEHLCGGSINTNTLSAITVDDLRSIGLSRAKSEYILIFCDAVRTRTIVLEDLASLSDEEIMKRLMTVRGIGSWTAKMFLIFVLKREDVLPFEDGAFLQSFKWLYGKNEIRKEDVIKKANKWHPYCSIAARYLYRALDSGLTKEPVSCLQNK